MNVRVPAGGREGHPAPEREAGSVQEAGGALGTRAGEGKCQTAILAQPKRSFPFFVGVF